MVILEITDYGEKKFLLYCTEICLKKWNNDLPDFYFVGIKIEQQVKLFLPGFPSNEENFMEFLYGVR